MGYHITILRTKDGQQIPISQAEVEAALASMPELKIESDEHWEFLISLPPYGEEGAYLIYSNDEIWAKNPENKTIQVMLDLADKLNARVRGDEFETYRTPDETYTHPDDLYEMQHPKPIPKQPYTPPKNKWWFLYIPVFIIALLFRGLFDELFKSQKPKQ